MAKFKLRVLAILLLCERTLSQFVPRYTRMFPEYLKINFMEMAKKYGHPAEEYQVETEDGYILTVHHIPGNGCPVLLEHGIADSDDTFIIRGNNSMAITLAEAGYDVWLGNARGNKYSHHHVSLNPDTDKQYWNFSMHEIGYFDLPAIIDFILDKTGQKQISAIGHSQGNTVFYILGATRPEYNEKIKVLIALAPICYLHNIKPPLNALTQFVPVLNGLLNILGQEDIFSDNSTTKKLIKMACLTVPLNYALCADGGLFALAGSDPKELEMAFIPVVLSHYPSGTSRMNVLHVLQTAEAKRFQQFDHGTNKNIQMYGSEIPPEYDLSKVTMRVELFVGKNDKIATVKDVNILRKKLPNAKYVLISHSKMNHINFIWGKNMAKYLFPPVLQVLEENCT